MKNFIKKSSAIISLFVILVLNSSLIVLAEDTDSETPAENTSTETSNTSSASLAASTTNPNTPTNPPTQHDINQKAAEAKAEELQLPETFSEIITNEKQCIPEDLLYGYFYTIIEEPLIIKDSLTYEEHKKLVENNERYISKICYRNTLHYSILEAGERFSFDLPQVLATECSQKGIDLENNYKYNTNPQIIFNCDPVQVLLAKGGTSLLEGYLQTIYSYAASLAGLIAVSIIVVSGIQIATSGGDSGTIDEAKKRIIKSFAGMAILFLSGLILYTINPNFFVKDEAKTNPVEQTQEAPTPIQTPSSTPDP